MFRLKYTEGAIPGKPLKRKLTDSEQKSRQQSYEAHRKPRSFNTDWQRNRAWLIFDNNLMKCATCIEAYSGDRSIISNLKDMENFITGSKNLRKSAVTDHEISERHDLACKQLEAKHRTPQQIVNTEAGKAQKQLQSAVIDKLKHLFRNTHAVVKNDRPLLDYQWLCELDKAKSLDIGETYLNRKAALQFTGAIAENEKQKTIDMLGSNVYSFMMDGSTDISGDEQESVYIRFSNNGKVVERFLGIGTPESTCSADLESFIIQMLDSYGLNKGMSRS